jgi:15-cis-phytoene synthase
MPDMERLNADYATCDALLKRDDRDRWLASLFAPASLRPHLHALYAFSLEIARVRQLVSEPALSEMRFQYWREVLAGEDGGAANPIAAALLDTIQRFDLPRDPFIALIDARLFDLYDAPMPNIAALEAYAKATAGTLFQLATSILDPAAKVNEAAEHAGIAYAVIGLLRALPWHLAARQGYIPLDILAAHGLMPEDLRAGRDKPALLAALGDMRRLARRHLRAFAGLLGPRDNAALAFLSVALCEPYLREMEKPGYTPLASHIALPEWRRLWLLWRAARKAG